MPGKKGLSFWRNIEQKSSVHVPKLTNKVSWQRGNCLWLFALDHHSIWPPFELWFERQLKSCGLFSSTISEKHFSRRHNIHNFKGNVPLGSEGCFDFGDIPITLLAKDARLSVASPRSPILTDPVGPVMKMLSHLRSLWMIGGARV